jgi:hypothetical protein
MSNATLQVGGGNWAAQDGKLLGYAVEPTSGRYLAREFTVNRNSSKWVLGSDGYLYEVPADQPALEYYSDGTFRGALVEPESTNLLTYSEFDASDPTNWGVVFGTGNYSYTLDSFQGQPALKQIQSVSGRSPIQQAVTFTATTTYTCSVKIDVNNSSGVSDSVVIAGVYNLSGVTGDTSVTYGEIDSDGRATFTFTTGADTSGDIRIGIGTSGGQTGTLVFGQPQLEQSPIATSYIPTTTGAVTRLKDDIFFTNASSVIGQSEGTLFVEVDWRLASDGVIDQQLLTVNDGTINNEIQIININGSLIRARIRAGGSIIYNTNPSSTTLSGIQKFALAYKTDDFAFYRNGSNVDSSTSGSLASLATLTDIDFGRNISAGDQANMWIRDARIYNTRLTDTQCQDLTTL